MESKESSGSGKDAGTAKYQVVDLNEQQRLNERELTLKLDIMRKTLGMGAPIQMCMDLIAVRGSNPKANLHEKVLLGTDLEITFADLLKDD